MSTVSPHAQFGAAANVPTPKLAVEFRDASRAAGQVREKEARVIERAEAHFDRQRPQWVAARYKQLLGKDGSAPAFKPPGHTEDRSARLMRAADHLAHGKQSARLQTIRDAADRLANGRSAQERGR